MKRRRFFRIMLFNLILAIAAVVLYSPGLLALRITDVSILRAGCSVVCVPALLYGFWMNNKSILYEHTMLTSSGNYVAISTEEGSRLENLKVLMRQIKNQEVLQIASANFSCIMEIFARTREPSNDYTDDDINLKLKYYLEAFETTLKREIAYEKFQTGKPDESIHAEICDTLKLLQNVFYHALDAILDKTLQDIELDQTVLRQKISMDGFEDSPFIEEKQGEDRYE